MAERTAWRICSTNRPVECLREERGKNGKPGPSVHDDLVGPGLHRHAPNQLVLNDTEHRTEEGKRYLCAIKDVFSNRVVGCSIDSRMKPRLATTALVSAIARRCEIAGCVHHSDRAGQFRSRKSSTPWADTT